MKRKLSYKIIVGSVGVATAFALSAHGQNIIINGNFANPLGFQPNPIPIPGGINGGWAVYGSSENPTPVQSNMSADPAIQSSSTSGGFALEMSQVAGDAYDPCGAYQIDSGIFPGFSYFLSGYVAADFNPSSGGLLSSPVGPVDLSLQFLTSTFSAVGPLYGGFNYTGGYNSWIPVSLTTGLAPPTAAYVEVAIEFMENGNQTSTLDMYFDPFTLVPTPEPSSLALVAMGLAAIPFYFIRRQKN
jgi:hypothetical protein